jgi:hypothetical protein
MNLGYNRRMRAIKEETCKIEGKLFIVVEVKGSESLLREEVRLSSTLHICPLAGPVGAIPETHISPALLANATSQFSPNITPLLG